MSEQFERLKAALAERYSIQRELGSGGMATVYLALDLKHRREVAVKVLRPELAATLGPERFVREIEIAARLTHPHILPLFDSGEASGFLYYVMPFIEGESLRERLYREEKLSVDDGIRLTDQVASALTYAHEQGAGREVRDSAVAAPFETPVGLLIRPAQRSALVGTQVEVRIYLIDRNELPIPASLGSGFLLGLIDGYLRPTALDRISSVLLPGGKRDAAAGVGGDGT